MFVKREKIQLQSNFERLCVSFESVNCPLITLTSSLNDIKGNSVYRKATNLTAPCGSFLLIKALRIITITGSEIQGYLYSKL